MKKILVLSAVLCFLAFPGLSHARSQDMAEVLSVETSVVSTFQGKTNPLKLRGDVPIKSVVKSDASGRAQLMFPDDATITVAPGTEISLAEFVETPGKENIAIDMSIGALRVITGEVVKRNPSSFTVETPQAVIGIRGTMVIIETTGELTRIYLSETSGKGVTVRNKHTGKTIEMTKPGVLITVGPKILEEKKATKAEAGNLKKLFRRKSGQNTLMAQADTQARRMIRKEDNLTGIGRSNEYAVPGYLPYTTAVRTVQFDEINREQEIRGASITPNTSGGTSNQPVNPPYNPGIPSNPDTPARPDQPVNPPATPDNPTNPGNPSTPDNPSNPGNPSIPDNPSTPDVPVPNVPPISPDTPVNPDTPVSPDTPVNPDNYRITLPDLAGTFAGTGTFNYYMLDNPTMSYGPPQSGDITFTVPRTYTSLNNDVYTINLTDVKVPGYQNGTFINQPAQGFDLSVRVDRNTGEISQIPGLVIDTSKEEIRALLLRGEFNDNQSGRLNTIHMNAGTAANGAALRGRNTGMINITKQ